MSRSLARAICFLPAILIGSSAYLEPVEVPKYDRLDKLARFFDTLYPNPPQYGRRLLQLEHVLEEDITNLDFFDFTVLDLDTDGSKSVVLSGHLRYGVNGKRPHFLDFKGRLTNRDPLERARGILSQQGGAPTTEFLEAASGRPVLYGPDKQEAVEDLVQKLLPAIEEFVDIDSKEESAVFNAVRDETKGTADPWLTWTVMFFAPLGWEVTSRPRPPGMDLMSVCAVEIEPFDGRIIRLYAF